MTAPNIRLLAINDCDSATLTVSPAVVATLPVSYLQDQTRAKVMRTTGITTQHVYGDWTGPKTISAMVLDRHNLSAAATLRFKLYEGAGQTGTLLYDSGDVVFSTDIPSWGTFSWGTVSWGDSIFGSWPVAFTNLWFDPVVAMSFDLTIVDPGNTAGYMQACRLMIGQYFEPSINASYGLDMHWEDDSTQIRTDGGSLRTDAKTSYRAWNISLDSLIEAERQSLTDVMRQVGMKTDIFISCFPEQGGARERDYAGRVKITQMPAMPNARLERWKTNLILEEA